MFFAVLKSAYYNISSPTCSEKSRQMCPQLILNKSISGHEEFTPGAYQQCPWTLYRGKNPGCRIGFPHFIRVFLHVQNTALHTVFFCEPFLFGVWNGNFLAHFKIPFPLLCTKNVPSLSITHAAFKPQNTGC